MKTHHVHIHTPLNSHSAPSFTYIATLKIVFSVFHQQNKKCPVIFKIFTRTYQFTMINDKKKKKFLLQKNIETFFSTFFEKKNSTIVSSGEEIGEFLENISNIHPDVKYSSL